MAGRVVRLRITFTHTLHESVHSISVVLIILSSSASLVVTPATYLIIDYRQRGVL
ncbi:hypothetical protein [Pelosinus fermentans]|uniref:hypothetical protein n=1 Tax=Pelosinus fermentans TaxID=365349 RepID=UPI00030E93A6|nr:hypothetical protein [Pelosinus fermentans]